MIIFIMLQRLGTSAIQARSPLALSQPSRNMTTGPRHSGRQCTAGARLGHGWGLAGAGLELGWSLANVFWISTVDDYLQAPPASSDVRSSVTPCAWPLATKTLTVIRFFEVTDQRFIR